MATLSYPTNRKIHPNRLVEELPLRLQSLQQIHDVNYGLLISSVIITVALLALAWLVAANRTHGYLEPNPMSSIAESAPYNTMATIQDRLLDTRTK